MPPHGPASFGVGEDRRQTQLRDPGRRPFEVRERRLRLHLEEQEAATDASRGQLLQRRAKREVRADLGRKLDVEADPGGRERGAELVEPHRCIVVRRWKEIGEVRRTEHGFDPLRDQLGGELDRALERPGPVVQREEQVAVRVYHRDAFR